jgi:pimeloyl-ACP methyl ester carboxylesterase
MECSGRRREDGTMPTAAVGDLNVVYEIHGDGEPVLMINGIGAERAGWGMQVPAVSREFKAIVYDNRDVGETGTGGSDAFYSIRQFADDAAGLLDGLGIEQAHIVGASMGGCIAQEFAISHPGRTRSTTIICSWPRVGPWLAELWSNGSTSSARSVRSAGPGPPGSGFSPTAPTVNLDSWMN